MLPLHILLLLLLLTLLLLLSQPVNAQQLVQVPLFMYQTQSGVYESFVFMGLGTPPQHTLMILDSGSQNIAVPMPGNNCECVDCVVENVTYPSCLRQCGVIPTTPLPIDASQSFPPLLSSNPCVYGEYNMSLSSTSSALSEAQSSPECPLVSFPGPGPASGEGATGAGATTGGAGAGGGSGGNFSYCGFSSCYGVGNAVPVDGVEGLAMTDVATLGTTAVANVSFLLFTKAEQQFQEPPAAGIVGTWLQGGASVSSATCIFNNNTNNATTSLPYGFASWLNSSFPANMQVFSLCYNQIANPGLAMFGGVNTSLLTNPVHYASVVDYAVTGADNNINVSSLMVGNNFTLSLSTNQFLIDTGTQTSLYLANADYQTLAAANISCQTQADCNVVITVPGVDVPFFNLSGNSANPMMTCGSQNLCVVNTQTVSNGATIIGLAVLYNYLLIFNGSAQQIGFSKTTGCQAECSAFADILSCEAVPYCAWQASSNTCFRDGEFPTTTTTTTTATTTTTTTMTMTTTSTTTTTTTATTTTTTTATTTTTTTTTTTSTTTKSTTTTTTSTRRVTTTSTTSASSNSAGSANTNSSKSNFRNSGSSSNFNKPAVGAAVAVLLCVIVISFFAYPKVIQWQRSSNAIHQQQAAQNSDLYGRLLVEEESL